MNVESVLNKINLFEELVINSGFRRDLKDFVDSIQQSQNKNLTFMKDISKKIQKSFLIFQNNSLNSELTHVLRSNEPFTSKDILEALEEIDDDEEIDAQNYFRKLNDVLNKLMSTVDTNKKEINSVKTVFSKYISDKEHYQVEVSQGLVSLVFKDKKSIGGLKEFSKVLNRWNNTLLALHGLIKSDSPEEISLVEIQNGSIDVIFNIDIDVAIDLAELVKIGFKVYGAYLLYKTVQAKEIIESYCGNAELIEAETEREGMMLKNIKTSVKNRLLEIHQTRRTTDQEIDNTAIDAKVKIVSEVITDHIVKGNEVKLLTPPKEKDDIEDGEGQEKPDLATELREAISITKERHKKLSSEDKNLLLETYSIQDDETTNP